MLAPTPLNLLSSLKKYLPSLPLENKLPQILRSLNVCGLFGGGNRLVVISVVVVMVILVILVVVVLVFNVHPNGVVSVEL